ncbi:MAG: hypothetical protein RLZZ225_493 [Pseudomonadota bacterium]|jgi:hypothetical protein
MLKTSLLKRSLFFFSLSLINLLLATPGMAKSDPLQLYRDEIAQAESNASQAVLDQLKSASEDSANTRPPANSQPATTPALPRSNSDKALIAPPSDALNDNTANPPSTNTNPWLKPNPWAGVKKNPWANVPIPGPSSPPTAAANSTIPSPPNIFARPQQPNYKTPSHAQP